MNKIILTFSFLIILSLFACTDDESTILSSNDEYVPGELVVGIIPQTEISQAFELMNQYNFYIDHASGFEYSSPWPEDSLEHITQYLSAISYLNNQGFGPGAFYHEIENKIIIIPFFTEMDSANQLDWLNQIDILQLEESNTDFAHLLIKVPVGKEIYWRDELKKSGIVEWVELNYIAHITHTN